MHDARPASSAAGELDRSFDTFGAGIREEYFIQIWNVLDQPFCEHTGEGGNVELHEVGQIAVEHALQGGAKRRVIAADREDAEAAQKVEIAGAVAVEQVLALPFLKSDVVSNRLQDPN